jgi:hypothetical protein
MTITPNQTAKERNKLLNLNIFYLLLFKEEPLFTESIIPPALFLIFELVSKLRDGIDPPVFGDERRKVQAAMKLEILAPQTYPQRGVKDLAHRHRQPVQESGLAPAATDSFDPWFDRRNHRVVVRVRDTESYGGHAGPRGRRKSVTNSFRHRLVHLLGRSDDL